MSDVEHKCQIDALLAEARADLERVAPADLAAEMAAGALVVDTRPVEQRRRDGDLPGALVIDRNVLEWRLDPTSPHRIPEAADRGRRIFSRAQFAKRAAALVGPALPDAQRSWAGVPLAAGAVPNARVLLPVGQPCFDRVKVSPGHLCHVVAQRA